jgi:bacillithiol biosynthesis cysteine-adding enzyme BshC
MIDFQNIHYSDTNSFSEFILDYLNGNFKDSLYSKSQKIEGFEKQIFEKSNHFIDRKLLVDVLYSQNKNFNLSKKSSDNIQSLNQESSFTVTTGHQLCLFTGPLYFIYKIISTINLCDQLNSKYNSKNFVPVYWMASEDHDFNEINHINLFGKKIIWDSKQNGAVGKMKLDGLEKLVSEVKSVLGDDDRSQKLINLIKSSYLNSKNLADSTRSFVLELFGKYGLVVIDGDSLGLKKRLIPLIKKDVLQKGFFDAITKSTSDFTEKYKQQAFVRDINFFKLSQNKRERITEDISEREIDIAPHAFSPNVFLRPLYQELILPNIAYVGGGAELTYWMQLKLAFIKEKIPFPILVLRNSALIVTKKQSQKINRLGFEIRDFFQSEEAIKKTFIIYNSKKKLSVDNEIKSLSLIYKNLKDKTDNESMKSSINALLHKHIMSIEDLHKKLVRLEKKQNESSLGQITNLKKSLFPNKMLQERHNNFIEYYFKYGDNFIETLKEKFDPLNPNFVILTF